MTSSCSVVGSCAYCNSQVSHLTPRVIESIYNRDKNELEVLVELKRRVLEGFDPCELQAKDKTSLLMHAVVAGRNEVVAWLMDHIRARGCPEYVNFQCASQGQTALHFACAHGNLTAAKILLESGASPEITDYYGATPLQIAVNFGHKEIVKKLVAMDKTETKDQLNAKYGPHRITALHAACMRGYTGVIKVLVKAGASIKAVDSCGCTPLHSAVMSNKLEAVSLLIDRFVSTEMHDAYLNSQTGFFQVTSLHLASERGYVPIVRKLLDSGASVHLRSAIDEMPFHAATRTSQIEVLTELLGAVPESSREEFLNARSGNKRFTPLHIASATGDLRVVNWLSDQGAFPAFHNADGDTPSRVAEKCGNLAVARALREKEFPLCGG